MSTNNTFNSRRFIMLFKQNWIHNSKLMLYSLVGYCGVVFIILSLSQMGNDLDAFGFDEFAGFLVGFVAVFGILYVGYAFPAFRNKENTIGYLMVPTSGFEKFLFEFINRVGIMLIVLPLLYWVTFHLQGYFFQWFTDVSFTPIGFSQISLTEFQEVDGLFWFFTLMGGSILLAFVLAFTGAAFFSKQPLVKTLFAIAIITLFFFAVIYTVIEPLGLSNYSPNDSLWLMPRSEVGAARFFAVLVVSANIVMLAVAYLKLKEKEV